MCHRAQETFVVIQVGKKKKGVRGILEITASFGGKFLEGGVWVFCFCVWLFFHLSLPHSLPPPQNKFFFFCFCVLFFFSYYKICLENQACPQGSLFSTTTESRKILVLLFLLFFFSLS